MRLTRLVGLLSLLIVPLATAQPQIPERLLPTTGQYVGPGARPVGLAGTYTGIADDYSAMWWNPAGLTQVKKIELQGSLDRTGYSGNTNYNGRARTGSTSGFRLNNAGLVFPVPVYQGAMSFAFGYNQLVAFDRRTRIMAPSAGSQNFFDDFDELESGSLGMWSLAGAMDVSPNLALGLGLNYFSGSDDYSRTGHYTVSDTVFLSEREVDTGISGFGANFGTLFRLGRFGRAGLMIGTPVIFRFSEDHVVNGRNGSIDYKMYSPAVFRVGGSFAPGRWLLAADVEYRDWTSLAFHGDTPYLIQVNDSTYLDVTKAEANQEIKDSYRATTRISVGGEYLFPAYGLRARAGYAYEPSNFIGNGGAEGNRNIFAFGLGVLVDKSVMFDLGVQLSKYSQDTSDGRTAPNQFPFVTYGGSGLIRENVNSNTALLTVSYRM
jgi:long-chain fatty acid transport protein